MATLATVSGRGTQVWQLSARGSQHRVEVLGCFSRTVRWYVDDRLVAAKSSADDHMRLTPGDRLEEGGPATETPVAEPPDVELPDWQVPGWLDWLLERANYVWPVLLAWILVRGELRRRRQQDQLKARLRAEAAE